MSEELKAAQARIAELESQFDCESIVCGSYRDERDAALAELSAIKAQEPVAFVHPEQLKVLSAESSATCAVWNKPGAMPSGTSLRVPLYAAPVSEAKAQGDAWAPSVNDYDHSIHSNPDAREWADFFVATFPGLADKHDLMIGWFANAMMAMHDHLARKAQGMVMPDVNAAAKALCNRHAMICGVDVDDQWKEYSQDFIADAETVLENARLNAAPVQQVSVPDGWRVERGYSPSGYVLNSPSGSMIRVCDSGGGGIETAFALFLKAMLAAAPAAPAADAGLVEALEKLARLGNGDKYGNSDGNLIAQAALAANSAKGVV